MDGAKKPMNVSPELKRVADRAKRDPSQRLLALAHLIDVPALERAYRRLRKNAATGVDGVTVEQYGQRLQENLSALHARMKAGQYRHRPIRRVHIPKADGRTRPIGVSCVEDKVVQGALHELLEVVYEQSFMDGSHGFRPGRRAHGALQAIDRAAWRGEARYVLEADIVSFFDSIDRKMLMEMLRGRIADESLMRLVGKCLRVGVLDGEAYSEPEVGTAQGSVLSPLLGNVYLHHALDLWFEQTVKPRLRGRAVLVRYADDFVVGFERRDDAEMVLGALQERMARYRLTLHPDKTRLIDFTPPSTDGGPKGGATFDFLGFTLHWQRTRQGRWRVAYRTRGARLRRSMQAVADWCRRHRHEPVEAQHASLVRKLTGHYNYFGVNGNVARLKALLRHAERAWRKWLDRRSQNAHMTWDRFWQLLGRYPLPQPRVMVNLWLRT